MPANHNPNFRIGKSNHYIGIIQPVNPTTGEWKEPLIYIPKMGGLNPPAGNAVTIALGKAIKGCRALQKFTGRPAK